MDSLPKREQDCGPMNRILLLGYLIFAGLMLVLAATVTGRIHPGDAQALAVLLVLLVVADVLLQRQPQR